VSVFVDMLNKTTENSAYAHTFLRWIWVWGLNFNAPA